MSANNFKRSWMHRWSVAPGPAVLPFLAAVSLIGCQATEHSGGGASARDTTSPAAALVASAVPLEITICAGPSWLSQIPSPDSILYDCQSKCESQDGSKCVYESLDSMGNKLSTLALVTDRMAGEIRWNTPLGIFWGLLMHAGGAGTTYPGEGITRKSWVGLESAGVRLVAMKWQPGVIQSDGSETGWFSRKNVNGTTVVELTRRPAAVMKWVREHLIPASVKFGTASCSGGSLATFGPVYWQGLDPWVDYQYITGGPPVVYDVNAFCSLRTASTRGVCENDPATSCTSRFQCGPGYQCAFPQANGPGEKLKALVDYIAATGTTCQSGQTDPAFVASSIRFTPGDWAYDHPVDLDNAVGGFPEWATDTSAGITYSTANLFTHIQTSQRKTYSLTEPGTHCESMRNPEETKKVIGKIRVGLAYPIALNGTVRARGSAGDSDFTGYNSLQGITFRKRSRGLE